MDGLSLSACVQVVSGPNSSGTGGERGDWRRLPQPHLLPSLPLPHQNQPHRVSRGSFQIQVCLLTYSGCLIQLLHTNLFFPFVTCLFYAISSVSF